MKNILVVGSSNTDMVIRVSRIPRPGETVLGGEFAMAPGGKSANQAVAAARAGGRVTFVARVGGDVFGERALTNFETDGIDTRFVFRSPEAPSGIALINVDKRGENSISVASGANALLSVGDVEKAGEAFAAADIVLLQLESPVVVVEAAARKARAAGIPVILNPAPARALDDPLLELITILTPNESEAEFLTGIPVRDESGAREAAGDVFNGALAVALAEKEPMKEALRFASAAAALSVTRPGAQPSAPTRAEIGAFLRANTESIAHKAPKM